ncbi:MAG: nickel-dependent lactate racemase [Candidatus Jordarchaeales archaeon]|nr:nickel-dependent lactate racemase [Candidatus Jordarchaeia archaeon]
MVKFALKYGSTEVSFEVPDENFAGTLEVRDVPGCANPVGEIKRSIRNPIGSPPLHVVMRGKRDAVIVVNDHTRDTRTREILAALLGELDEIGFPSRDITIIFGCGTHRKVKDDEAKAILGEDVWSKYEWVSHDCDGNLTFLGETSFGNRIYINSLVAEADAKILTGDITFHYYAGYTGGRKSILPGVSARETILFNHAMMLHPAARSGVLDGNPVHLDMTEAARLAKPDFIVNVVQNTKGEIVRAFSGDLEAAFMEGVKLVDSLYKAESEPADIIILSAGGYPKDIDFYQAHKALDNVIPMVKDGGCVIFLAECRDGVGNQVFYEWMKEKLSIDEMEKRLKSNFKMGGHKAYYLAKALEKVKIFMLSSLPAEELENVFNVTPIESVEDGLRKALETIGKNAKIKVVPHGAAILASIKKK